ncbi:MAG: ATP-binding protein, partial [Methanosarcinales archaeon]
MNAKKKIFTIVPEDEFVDREKILDILYTNALDAAREASDNTFIIGRRRVGKSAILTRLYDKLFFEQDIVAPFYYNYEGKGKRAYTIAESYFTNFVSQYIAFKKSIFPIKFMSLENALDIALELKDEGLSYVIENYLESKKNQYLQGMLEFAIGGPRMVSNVNQSPICVIIDEFQYILGVVDDEGWDVDLKGKYQFGVEGTYCPHFVSGSAVNIIVNEILTKGALVGRFGEEHLDKLDLESALELGNKLSNKFGFELPYEQNIYLANYTDRLPYYIYRILYTIYKNKEKIATSDVLSNAISSEITRGGIYGELERQLMEYVELNSLKIIRSVLYLAANYDEKQIIPREIAEKLKVPEIEVSKALVQISKADLIQDLGGFYYNVPDPIMREFLRTQYFHNILKIPIEE